MAGLNPPKSGPPPRRGIRPVSPPKNPLPIRRIPLKQRRSPPQIPGTAKASVPKDTPAQDRRSPRIRTPPRSPSLGIVGRRECLVDWRAMHPWPRRIIPPMKKPPLDRQARTSQQSILGKEEERSRKIPLRPQPNPPRMSPKSPPKRRDASPEVLGNPPRGNKRTRGALRKPPPRRKNPNPRRPRTLARQRKPKRHQIKVSIVPPSHDFIRAQEIDPNPIEVSYTYLPKKEHHNVILQLEHLRNEYKKLSGQVESWHAEIKRLTEPDEKDARQETGEGEEEEEGEGEDEAEIIPLIVQRPQRNRRKPARILYDL
ncbi:hypothetical protein K493DRAFT_48102 [Basidiobolus meristosporus CBS 931.73]|uniref:Uncharacterized protein n=1 Tax=Basidiobolus meristosporus CBS 931.73 TaxID=1314790 RepID=A0A1Y1Y1E9_9FUNG|nr:hypothetical protein K493DRAFT_48102 [Basidiobolus meristosporus CBS 931.73]|eukprot:ORX91830.1 hypothetical protein K493DRAFT_48102 [Basidiobolus meristosporus CBS 931.73]